jgi:hypothetical protein
VRLEIDVPAEVRAGHGARFTLRLQNPSERPLDVALQGRPPAFDVIIRDADGRAVWRRLEGEVVPAILQLRTLGRGDTLRFEVAWDGRASDGTLVGPGRFTVQGELPSDPPLVFRSAPAPLRILP